jgi:hypothetical protein
MQKGFAIVYLLIAAVILAIIGGAYFLKTKKNAIQTVPKACTMEAKLCPDGSSVGRSGSNCEFSPCPSTSKINDWKIYTSPKYFYQVSYPFNWKYENYNDDSVAYFSDPNKVLPPDTYPSSLDLSINVIESKGTLSDYMEEINPATGLKNKELYKKTGETTVDGENAIITFGGCCGDTGTHVFVKNNNFIYNIESIGETKSPLFDSFLSSFKFTSQD